jgi:hypothetical protein
LSETTTPERGDSTGPDASPRTALALVVAWCAEEPWRRGEVLLCPPASEEGGRAENEIWFGRGPSLPGRPVKASLGQLRPGQWLPSTPLAVPAISRYQLSLATAAPDRVRVRNHGRCPLLLEDAVVAAGEIGAGELVQLGKQLLFVCARRYVGPASGDAPAADFPFGGPDRQGIVGESLAIWSLRAQIADLARRDGHVLVTGPSGSGKELVAQALHALSARAARPIVARNAATLPEGLIDAELFGNARNYPNPGMPARAGLVGDAHLSTLFLDELAELAPTAQAHLLRVLDAGEYHRLGESQARVSAFRLVAATNRDPLALKHDLLARLTYQIAVPGLDSRRDDIPLLVGHLLRTEELAPPGDGPAGTVSLELMRRLLRHRFQTGQRELRSLLWQHRAGGGGAPPAGPSEGAVAPASVPLPGLPTPAAIQRCLDQHNGVLEESWRALGLRNRFALMRLIKRHDLEVRRRPGRR